MGFSVLFHSLPPNSHRHQCHLGHNELYDKELSMDESILNAICKGNSCYLSLRNDETRPKGATLQPPHRRLSKEHTTCIHLAIQHCQHWAAVQISVSPFDVREIPRQKFFRCSLRYTWCCAIADKEGNFSEACKDLQRRFDIHYGFNRWDFSSMEYASLFVCYYIFC